MKKAMKACILTICFLVALAVPAGAADRTELLSVGAGQSRTMNVEGLQRAAIANPEVADVVVASSSELLLVGKQTGTTTLIIWSAEGRRSYQVEVGAGDSAMAAEIKRILGYPDIRVNKVSKTVILEGSVSDQYQRSRAEKIAGAYGDKVVNLLEISNPVQIKLEAKIVEISKARMEELGVKYFSFMGENATAAGTFFAGQSQVNPRSPNTFDTLGTFAPINAQLNLMIQAGYAKLLSQPNMVTLSGEKAKMLVGGQIPVPVSNDNGQVSIEWKDYGIMLEINAEASLEGIITSRVKAEVSALEWNSIKKIKLGPQIEIPPIRMRKAETSIALGSGQTMAIGGLISNDITRDVTKIPLLGDLPIIGELFRSTSFNRGETELIILVTPSIVDSKALVPRVSQEMQDMIIENQNRQSQNGKNQNGQKQTVQDQKVQNP